MTLSAQARYLLVSLAILTAAAIQWVRGYKPVIVVTGAVVFLVVGNLLVWLTGWKERAAKRKQKRDYYAGRG